MTFQTDYAGLAALAICASLLLALLLAIYDRGLLLEHEVFGVLRDAATTHENAVGRDGERERHLAVVDLIEQIIARGNSVQRRQTGETFRLGGFVSPDYPDRSSWRHKCLIFNINELFGSGSRSDIEAWAAVVSRQSMLSIAPRAHRLVVHSLGVGRERISRRGA